VKLLLDNNLSFRTARALQILFEEHTIVALRDRFPENAPDIHWIEELDQEKSWAVVTRDLRIRTRPHERRAMDASAIVFFFLAAGWKNLTFVETTVRLIRLIPKIAAQVDLAERGRFELPINAGSKLKPYRD
jgi:hypothetical protein